ncbi:ribosome maturation factor RimM [Merismopedia glauca]|uniref:Ribosome maturation factor RimM n=1 Tax=Merismopedia glauca CCAP 1448/3 TaxID=1296344 RepID=A0A2T1BZG3_9CYAN|nr:ribosome maturation factor RimM [Merismopedia glauca]PSB01344.1 ribosome maturation factor RimM [Merismopedia glauca CCAP 1448/3]
MTESSWLEIGTIVASHGMKGEVRVYPNTDFPERFENAGTRWLLRKDAKEPEAVELLEGRFMPGKGLYIVKLAGLEHIKEADALRGSKLMVPESDRPTLGADEYHVLDLQDLEVFHRDSGEYIGLVVDIIAAGNDLLVVRRPEVTDLIIDEEGSKPKKKQDLLIPFVREIVPVVDLSQKRVEITPPPGLLELS